MGSPPQAADIAGRTDNVPELAVRPPPGWVSLFICLLLALAVWAVFGQTLHYEFVNYDDPVYVTANPQVEGGLTWENLRWALTTLHFGLWHPLTWISHMLDCQFFGLRPGGHHLTSLLLHTANTVLLFVVVRRMTGALWRSALVAALFALHPLHVESVAWVSERKDVLSTFFVMLTVWAYVRYAEKAVGSNQLSVTRNQESGIRRQSPEDSPTRNAQYATRITEHRSLFYLLALLFFACGLMSKPMIVTLPAVLLLLDYWPLKRFDLAALVSRPSLPARLIAEKLPFVLAALLTSLITLYARQPGTARCRRWHSVPSRPASPMRPSPMPGISCKCSGPAI